MMKNWKTTSTGITMIVGAVVGIYFAATSGHLNEGSIMSAITSFLGGLGLLFARDGHRADAQVKPLKIVK